MYLPQLGRMAARQCLPENKNLGQFNWRDVQNMGCLVTELGLTSVRQIPRDAVCHRDVLRDLVQCLIKSGERDNSMVCTEQEPPFVVSCLVDLITNVEL